MPHTQHLSHSERTIAEARAMAAEAQAGLAQLQHALHALGVNDHRFVAAQKAAAARGIPQWLAAPPQSGTTVLQPATAAASTQTIDTRRVRKHRFMV